MCKTGVPAETHRYLAIFLLPVGFVSAGVKSLSEAADSVGRGLDLERVQLRCMRSGSEHPIGHRTREPEVVRRVGQCLNLVAREVRRDRLLLGEQIRQRPILLQRFAVKGVDKIMCFVATERRLANSIFSTLQKRVISVAASCGMRPSPAWARASAASQSR